MQGVTWRCNSLNSLNSLNFLNTLNFLNSLQLLELLATPNSCAIAKLESRLKNSKL